MLIEVKGTEFQNKGALMMLQAIIKNVTQLIPTANFALRPGPNFSYAQIVRAGAVQRFATTNWSIMTDTLTSLAPRKIKTVAKRYGIVFADQIDATLDASGFAYGTPWPKLNERLTAAELTRAAREKKPYVFLPQAFGSIATGSNFAKSLQYASAIYARDPESRANLAKALYEHQLDKVRTSPDFTFDLQGPACAGTKWGVDRKTILIVPNVNAMSELNKNSPWSAAANGFFSAIVEEIRRNDLTPRILNHGGKQDYEFCESIAMLNKIGPVVSEEDPLMLKGVIRDSGAVVSGRYHACSSALSSGVPCLGLSWSHKYMHLFSDFGLHDNVLVKPSTEIFSKFLQDSMAKREEISASLFLKSRQLIEINQKMWRDVAAIIKK
jgi:polysaccharide pyruvyl transferase WcaK-like protein